MNILVLALQGSRCLHMAATSVGGLLPSSAQYARCSGLPWVLDVCL